MADVLRDILPPVPATPAAHKQTKQTNKPTGVDGSLREPARRATPKQKQYVIAGIAEAVRDRGLPPLDERLKAMLAAAVGHLIAEGYDLAEIRDAGVRLALMYTDRAGYYELSKHLRLTVRREAEERAEQAHLARKREEESAPIDPAVAAVIRGAIASKLRRGPDTGDIECVVCRQLTDGRCACGAGLHPRACRLRHTCEAAA